jgi:hypothetical protein
MLKTMNNSHGIARIQKSSIKSSLLIRIGRETVSFVPQTVYIGIFQWTRRVKAANWKLRFDRNLTETGKGALMVDGITQQSQGPVKATEEHGRERKGKGGGCKEGVNKREGEKKKEKRRKRE